VASHASGTTEQNLQSFYKRSCATAANAIYVAAHSQIL
jgi:hypothetical protein